MGRHIVFSMLQLFRVPESPLPIRGGDGFPFPEGEPMWARGSWTVTCYWGCLGRLFVEVAGAESAS